MVKIIASALPAVIKRAHQQWFAEYFGVDGGCRRCAITSGNAWDFDIDNELPVTVELTGKSESREIGKDKVSFEVCRILKRKGNKLFVKTEV